MFTSGPGRRRRNREGTSLLKEVTKLIKELRADLATSKEKMDQRMNETMQLIDILRADLAISKEEIRKINESIREYAFQEEPSESSIWSIRKIFTVSYLDGLRELADLNLNWTLKTVWSLIVFVNLLLLSYGMRSIVKDYFDEVTITRVHQIETNFTEINRPSICFPLLPDFLHLTTNNGSNDDHHPIDNQSLLHLGYIKAMMPPLASSGLWLSHIPSGNLTWSEFESLPARSSVSISYEKASLLSQNTLYDMLYSRGIGQIDLKTFGRSKFHSVAKLYSEILMRRILNSVEYFSNTRICLPINLSEARWIAVNGKQLQEFHYAYFALAECTQLSILHKMLFNPQHFNAKTYTLSTPYPASWLEPIYRSKVDATQYLLYPTKYIHLNLTRQPCYDASGEIYPRGFGETICFQDCLWNNHAILFNCSFWEDLNPDEQQQDIKVCHISHIFHQLRSNMSQMCIDDQNQLWCNNGTMRSVEEWGQVLMQAYRELVIEAAYSIGNCQEKCANFMFCEEWELQYESLYKHDVVEFINNTIGTNLPLGLILNRTYVISAFISVNEDVLKASPQEFLANLGGIMGLYFGASLCGYLHLLLFLLISCCKKIMNMMNKPLSNGRQSIDASIREH